MSSGTPKYMAFEQFAGRGKVENPFACDVFSLGVILFHLVFKEYPFTPNVYQDLRARSRHFMQDYLTDPQRNKHNVQISDELRSLLEGMLRSNPRERISLGKVLASPWFRRQARLMSTDMAYL